MLKISRIATRAVMAGATLLPMAAAAGQFTTLYQFKGGADGNNPNAGLVYHGSSLFGTTSNGGTPCDPAGWGCGTLFQVDVATRAETVLHRFSGGDGQFPYARLTLNAGNFYGTTQSGGSGNASAGVVFKFTPANNAFEVLTAFDGTDGSSLLAPVTAQGGVLYGASNTGGSSGPASEGTVFKIDPSSGAETVLYDFAGGTDAARPAAALIAQDGVLYGTTISGGGEGCFDGQGCGTVFKLDVATGTETVLHSFTGGADGGSPLGMVLIGQFLYGVASQGGNTACSDGCGTIFRVDTTTGAFKLVYRFAGGQDGEGPVGLIYQNGHLYGSTTAGGGSGPKECQVGCGTLFAFNAATHAETVLFRFTKAALGYHPSPLLYQDGTLYGTTESGGVNTCNQKVGCGTVFAFKP